MIVSMKIGWNFLKFTSIYDFFVVSLMWGVRVKNVNLYTIVFSQWDISWTFPEVV